MQDHIGVPITTCLFSSSSSTSSSPSNDKLLRDHRPGQTTVSSTYRTKISGRSRLITVTWCRDLLLRGLTVSSPEDNEKDNDDQAITRRCKVDLKPWSFWKRQGSRRLVIDGTAVQVRWDLRAARFKGETEPCSSYYVAVVAEDEVVLLLGDLKSEAYRKIGSRPALVDPTLVSRREQVFGKRKFSTRVRFHEKGKLHEISIQCSNLDHDDRVVASATSNEPEMEIRLDGQVFVHVKHLQWKFRGNESIHVENNKLRVEVFWDVHDWLFTPGLSHALFIFKPVSAMTSASSSLSSSSSSSLSSSSGSFESLGSAGSSEFCLFLYAWKVE